MRVSKFIKVNKDILLEFIYDDNNNIGDSYKILQNNKDNLNLYSYISGSGSITNNGLSNQLFKIDSVNNTYGLVNTNNYSFLQIKDYAEGFPAKHDTLKIHVPVNYTFGEYIGCYVKIYTYDYPNKKLYDISNFYFDSTDVNQTSLLDFNNPPLLFQDKLWGKSIRVDFPSVSYLSGLRSGTTAKPNSINFNLTNGTGLSINSPIFIDFQFINSKKTVSNVVTFNLSTRSTISIPQTPDFEKLGIKIEHSKNGDYFEIYGIYNGNITEFNTFMLNSVQLGKRYYVEYTITLFEQNIRGKSLKIVMTDSFNEKVEYRPIIKYSTTTAIIDVEMNVIDAVDTTSIQRRASYGMLQDEVAKYSLNLTKINLLKANKPKIYNVKSPEGAGIFGNLNGSAYSDGRLYGNAGGSLFSTNTAKNLFGIGRKGQGANIGTVGIPNESNQNGLTLISDQSKPQLILQPVPVDRLVLADRFNILAKSENARVGRNTFYGIGRLQVTLQSFDNIIQFRLAQDVNLSQTAVTNGNSTRTGISNAPVYMDLSNMGEIKLVIKNQQSRLDFQLYTDSNLIDLVIGQVLFRIPASKMNEVRKIYDSGINVFYITALNNTIETVIYSGLFTIYDTRANVDNLNQEQAGIQESAVNAEASVISEVAPTRTGTALVTRRIITAGGGTVNQESGAGATSSAGQTNLTNSSVELTQVEGATNYKITTNSSLVIDGYEYTNQKLKTGLNITTNLLALTFKSSQTVGLQLFSLDKFIGKLSDIKKTLESKLTTEEKVKQQQTSELFKSSNKPVVVATTSGTQSTVTTTTGTTTTTTTKTFGPDSDDPAYYLIYKGITWRIRAYNSDSLQKLEVLDTDGVKYNIYPTALKEIYGGPDGEGTSDFTNLIFSNGSQLWWRPNGGGSPRLIDELINVLDSYKRFALG